jgi:sarcosine oxidase subunit alpha
MSPARLPAPWGSRLDRGQVLGFRFEGTAYQGFAGDTLASALIANGVDVLSRSFKYHRPRGVLTLRGLDANAYVQLGDEPNAPADRLPLREGLVATGQNHRGSLVHDRGAGPDDIAGGRLAPNVRVPEPARLASRCRAPTAISGSC